MENQFRSICLKFSGRSSSNVFLLVLSLLLLSKAVVGITDQELEILTSALRSNGYNLFSNAIATSDLRYQILAVDSFTFFSPIDSALFSLDMESDASEYVQTLRYHVVGRRLTMSDLRNLSSVSHLDTLLPNQGLLITNRRTALNGILSDAVTINGVPISTPDLFLGSSFAVHGLDGILSARFPSELNFSGDVSTISPAIWPDKYLSPISSPIAPNLIAPASSPLPQKVPVEITGNSSFKRHGKQHEHRSRRKRHVRKPHGSHRHGEDDLIRHSGSS
ncbi:hypothetical protein HHK36_004172 [Tetracentron sinense]|uniref:FAS1 domain-containing protein n=1 Tax=Tetracentron sinense TaxID=13715 RepID=A0A834ZTT7_TETSI|nr:hypothetical protein HHK36_004172 [Tetracentron sinense]